MRKVVLGFELRSQSKNWLLGMGIWLQMCFEWRLLSKCMGRMKMSDEAFSLADVSNLKSHILLLQLTTFTSNGRGKAEQSTNNSPNFLCNGCAEKKGRLRERKRSMSWLL